MQTVINKESRWGDQSVWFSSRSGGGSLSVKILASQNRPLLQALFQRWRLSGWGKAGASVMHGLHIYAKSPVNCISMSNLWWRNNAELAHNAYFSGAVSEGKDPYCTHTHTACGENGLFAVGKMYLKLKQFSSQVSSFANMLLITMLACWCADMLKNVH